MFFVLAYEFSEGPTIAPVARAGNAVVLFLVVAVVLGVLLVGVALMLATHRARRQSQSQQESPPGPDPWHESARRMQEHRADDRESDTDSSD